MIEADWPVTELHQGFVRGFRLRQPLRRGWQVGVGDLFLLRAEPGHVRVAEHGDALRPERMRQRHGALDVVGGLLGQAVHQIDVDAVDAEVVEQVDRGFDRLERLDAAGGGLHMGVEVLHAEAGAVDADVAQRRGEDLRDITRVKLDGVLA